MEKKYIILVTYDPYGRDDGFQMHPANCILLNNKIYNTKEEAEEVMKAFAKELSHREIKGKFNIDYELFEEIRRFILNNAHLQTTSNSHIENCFSKDKMITIFLNMYDLNIDYNAVKYDEDETLYHSLMGDEPIVKIIEIEN